MAGLRSGRGLPGIRGPGRIRGPQRFAGVRGIGLGLVCATLLAAVGCGAGPAATTALSGSDSGQTASETDDRSSTLRDFGATVPKAALLAADERLRQGDPAAAAAIYDSLIREGFDDPAIHANLGTAWLRQGEPGRAALAYTRASRSAPRDPAIRQGLAAALAAGAEAPGEGQGAQVGGIASGSGSAGGDAGAPAAPGQGSEAPAAVQLAGDTPRWDPSRLLSPAELSTLALLLWWLLVSLVILRRHRRPGRGRRLLGGAAWLLGVVLALLLGTQLLRAGQERLRPAAIVVAAAGTPVTEAPGPASQVPVVMALAPGSRLRVLEARDAWRQVEGPDGAILGWVPAWAVEELGGARDRAD